MTPNDLSSLSLSPSPSTTVSGAARPTDLELDKNVLLYLLFLSSVSPQTAKRRILLNERTSLQKEDGEVLRMHFRLAKCQLFSFLPRDLRALTILFAAVLLMCHGGC